MTVRGDLAETIKQLIRERSWERALALIDESSVGAVGADFGWLRYKRGVILYMQSRTYAELSQRLLLEAVPLLEEDPYWLGGCYVQLAAMALYRDRLSAVHEWLDKLAALAKEHIAAKCWTGRKLYGRAQAHLREGEFAESKEDRNTATVKYAQAIRCLRDSLSFYADSVGPFDSHDQMCQVRMAKTQLAEALWLAGLRDEAVSLGVEIAGDPDCYGMAGATFWRGMCALYEGKVYEAVDLLASAKLLSEQTSNHRLACRAAEAMCEAIALLGNRDQLIATASVLIDQAVADRNVGMVYRLQRLVANSNQRQEGQVCGRDSQSV